ncbi:MAG: glycosyltransferase family 4 protein [Patescibacteria group bacterium]
MRIAVFIKNTTLHSTYGGLETQNKVLCESLAKFGHEVYVFAPKKGLSLEEKVENNVNYIFVPAIFKRFSYLYSLSGESWINKSYSVFAHTNAQKKFDIVVSQSSAGLGIIKHKNVLEVPIVAIAHGSKMGELKTRLRELSSFKEVCRLGIDIPHIFRAFFITQREFVLGSNKIVAVSNAVKVALIEETFINDSKVEVIHNGLDPELFSFKKSSAHKFTRLLYVGRLEQSKGIHILLKAISSKKIDNVILTIIGSGPYEKQLKHLVKELDLYNVVSFKGSLPHDKVINEYAEADIFILPSLRVEGFPMTLVEAMLSGLPIIASNIGGNSDAVTNEETGFLVTPGETKELRDRIHALVSSPKLQKQFGKNGRMIARSHFSVNIMTKKYLDVFKDLINENS